MRILVADIAPFYILHAVPSDSDVLRVLISQGGSDIAGEAYNLSCSILKIINGLTHNPNATWTVNGEHIQEGDGVNVHTLETSKSVLTFNPLKTSHTGNYSCHGDLTSPAPPNQFSVHDYHPLIVSSELLASSQQTNKYINTSMLYLFSVPTPVVTVSHADTILYAGTNVSLICNVSLDAAVDSNVSVDIEWHNMEDGLLTNDTRVIASPTVDTTLSFISRLTLTPLTDEDQGDFTCKTHIHSSDHFIKGRSEKEMSISIFVSQRC